MWEDGTGMSNYAGWTSVLQQKLKVTAVTTGSVRHSVQMAPSFSHITISSVQTLLAGLMPFMPSTDNAKAPKLRKHQHCNSSA